MNYAISTRTTSLKIRVLQFQKAAGVDLKSNRLKSLCGFKSRLLYSKKASSLDKSEAARTLSSSGFLFVETFLMKASKKAFLS